MSAAVRLENVTWTYPGTTEPSLRGVSLEIRAGEFVVLCGASGSGKSTLLRTMDGLVPHFHENGTFTGHVTVEGLLTSGADLAEAGRITGTVLQHPRRQFFAQHAASEIAFALENFGVEPDEMRERINDSLIRLAPYMPLDLPLSQLSGGQQQQVALSAATAHKPRVLLLDEPSSNLSADAIHRLTQALTSLKQLGVTIVVSEHRLRYLSDLIDRIVIVADGAIHTEWSAEDLRKHDDEDLHRLGLRGSVQEVHLPSIDAAGASVVPGQDPTPATSVTDADLELRGIRCQLGGQQVLEIDSAVFPAGHITAIRGVNGSGKSTLARVIAGLQRAEGKILRGGRAQRRRELQRQCAIVMQDVQRQMFAETAIREIQTATSPSLTEADAHIALESLDLERYKNRHPLSLSGGQQQRLAIACAHASGGTKPVVIFDEPSTGVDQRHLASISHQIRQTAESGAVVLLISHDDGLIELAADRQLVLQPLVRAQSTPHGATSQSAE